MTSDRSPIAAITGGSSGIGRAFVAALHEGGYRIFVCGRDPERLRQVERDHPGVRCLVWDMADRRAVGGFIATVLDASPCVDLLVSNAGILRNLDFADPAMGTAWPDQEIGILAGPIQLVASAMSGCSPRHRRASSWSVPATGWRPRPRLRCIRHQRPGCTASARH